MIESLQKRKLTPKEKRSHLTYRILNLKNWRFRKSILMLMSSILNFRTHL